eukprot:tig00000821_g4502.t1
MAEPFVTGPALYIMTKIAVKCGKMVVKGVIDYATLKQYEEEYEALKDKRKRPGPQLRKVLTLLRSGEAEQARKLLKEMGGEFAESRIEDAVEAGMELLDLL